MFSTAPRPLEALRLRKLLPRPTLVSILLLCAGLSAALASPAAGHQNDCHTTRVCPSDDHTYIWTDAAGALWSCAAAGTVDYDPYLDTHVVTQGTLTWYCRPPRSATVPPPGTPAPGTPAPGTPVPGEPAPPAASPVDPSEPPPADSSLGRPLLALPAAKSVLRRMIQRRTGRLAHNLTYKCLRVDEFTIACRPAWTDSVYVYAGRTTVKLAAGGTISSSFTGTRARRTCIGRHRTAKLAVRRCSHRVHW